MLNNVKKKKYPPPQKKKIKNYGVGNVSGGAFQVCTVTLNNTEKIVIGCIELRQPKWEAWRRSTKKLLLCTSVHRIAQLYSQLHKEAVVMHQCTKNCTTLRIIAQLYR